MSWNLRETMPEGLMSEALRWALAARQLAAGLVVHSDQGRQYAATRFKQRFTHYGVPQSISRRSNSYDNAESF
jgi:transposase InsO family protein